MTFTVEVLDERSAEGDAHGYVLRIEHGPRVLASFRRTLPAGATMVVRGRLEPLDESRNPGEPSERSIEAEHRIEGRIESATVMRIIDAQPHSLDAWIAWLHVRALALLRERLADPGASIVAGELWGDRSALPPELRAEFQETGTVHVLVTAGLHVGLIAWLMLLLCESLTLPRAIACAIAIAVIWAFALFSGMNLPAFRAATMATWFLLARAAGRSTVSWHALIVAALIVAIALPDSLTSPSFWLSFCCVGAILALAPVLEPWMERLPLHPRVREAFLLTIATQIGTWPISVATFLQFSPYAVAANLSIVPLVPATMLLGIAQLMLAPIAPLAQAAANLNSWLLSFDLGVVHVLATLPGAVLHPTPAPVWCIACYESAIGAAAFLIVRYRAVTAALGLLIVATGLVVFPPVAADGKLHVTVLDVGQADAIVIQTPLQHTILVDAGGRLERGPQTAGSAAERVGERIVVPFLLRQGIHTVDALIVSHPHGDHEKFHWQTPEGLKKLPEIYL